MKIAVCGLWHLGEVYSACLAELGHKVYAIDDSKTLITDFLTGTPPVPEPKISHIIKKNIKKGALKFCDEYSKIRLCDVLWITIDTPVNRRDDADITPILNLVDKALPFIKDGMLIIVSSQLPAGTSKKIIELIRKKRQKLKFGYSYVPENLRLGEAVESFLNSSRLVVGIEEDSPYGGKFYKKVLLKVFDKFKRQIIFMNLISAELVKHATNSFLATSLSFTYDISDISEKLGADISLVTKALKADSRIGMGAYLDSSTGFSGGTLARDLRYLSALAKANNISLPVISSVFNKNEHRKKIIYQKLKAKIKSFEGKTFSFFGLTYKAGTPTLRRSLPLRVAKELYKMGACLSFYDPYIDQKELKKEMGKVKYKYSSSYIDAISKANAVICITPSSNMLNFNFTEISKRMNKPKIFFDARNYFVKIERQIKNSGLCYIGIGR